MSPEAGAPPRISAVLITRDEERNLDDCLSAPLADEIVVVDCGSRDRTPRDRAPPRRPLPPPRLGGVRPQKAHALSLATHEWCSAWTRTSGHAGARGGGARVVARGRTTATCSSARTTSWAGS